MLYKMKQEKVVENKPTRFHSSKQESYVAKKISGKVTSNSGATPYAKGDIKSEKFLIECKTKTSSSDSISIKKQWLKKLKEESLFMGKQYEALIFSFGPDEENYAIIDIDLFNELKQYLEEDNKHK